MVNIFPVLQAGVDGILKLMSYSQVENETGIIVEIIIVEKRKVFSLCVAYLPEDRNVSNSVHHT